MALRLWPSIFENKDFISKEEKKLLRSAEKNFQNGHFAIGIDPMGVNERNSKMGLYISPTEGLVTFSIMEGDVNLSISDSYLMSIQFFEDTIYKRLLDSYCLIARNGKNKTLRFPYKHIIVFPSAVGLLNKKGAEVDRLTNKVYRGFFIPINSEGKETKVTDLNIFNGINKSYDGNFTAVSDIECRAIFERLVPEYSVIVKEKEPIYLVDTKTPTEEDMLITGSEAEYKTFVLDEYQVGIVNEMRKGHRVVLANPGAGKSVLLLSKAFKYSNIYKDSNILLTCFNNNLADSYKFKYACAGYNKKNLYIMTFHKLVQRIYKDCLKTNKSNIEENDIRKCLSLIKSGKIELRFKAIFIDEVQIFDPLYLEVCYCLLDRTKDDYAFLMAGDLNQKIRSSSKKGDAPWKRMEGVKLDFTGRVRYIEKNYRNSELVSQYILGMLSKMNDRLSMLGIINSLEYEYNSFKIGTNKTIALNVQCGVKRTDIKNIVVKSVKEISEKYDIAYNDIAILFPYKQHAAFRYFFLNWIVDGLKEERIPYSVIVKSVNDSVAFRNTDGVVLSTIESSLGLDFKAVIVAGLKPYDSVVDSSSGKAKIVSIDSWKAIQSMSPNNKESVQNQMRAIYTACSRARDVLYVISDMKSNTPMEEIIRR